MSQEKHFNVADPARFGDSIALQTQWTELPGRGPFHGECTLMEAEQERMEYRPNTGARYLYYLLIFFAFELLLASVGVVVWAHGSGQKAGLGSALLIMAYLLYRFGVFGLRKDRNHIVFDRRSGSWGTGPKSRHGEVDWGAMSEVGDLSDVHALQIIPVPAVDKQGRTRLSYQLNFVHRDAARRHVMHALNLEKIQEDARRLSRFLEKPLWDATTES
jgi:hypothetical protein